MSVLVVEDDLATCELMQRMLSRAGYRVNCAHTLAQAMGQLNTRPCCVLLDLGLPDGNGVDLLRHVRDDDLWMPVAVVSGNAGEKAADAVMLRPSAFFVKPVDVADILNWVRAVCPGDDVH